MTALTRRIGPGDSDPIDLFHFELNKDANDLTRVGNRH